MRRAAVLLLLLLLPVIPADWDGCTTIAVSPQATLEGSAFATHTNDCQACDPRVVHIPARDYDAGALRPVAPFRLEYPRYVGAHRSESYAPLPGQNATVPVGFIPQVPHTFAYWEAAYPLLNEHGLGFGESTSAAKLVGASKQSGTGVALFSIGELMRVALERCASAVCAIDIMGELGEKYGFFGEDPGAPGAGEVLSVVDRDEAWVFHITSGLNGSSATWVAQRVPDGHVAVTANQFIIRRVECKDKHNFRCGTTLFSNARDGHLCDFEKEVDFDWTRCYGFDVRYFSYMPGLQPIPWYTTVRTWRVQSHANPDLSLKATDDFFYYNFSVPVKSRVSRADVMDWMRDRYEGTGFDMTRGILAGPFDNPNRLEGGMGMHSIQGQFARGISIPRTNYGLLVEAKQAGKASRSIAWFATDQPASSVFVPFFAAADTCAPYYSHGQQEVFTRDSAWWAFNFVANWMNINYAAMAERHVTPAVREEQRHILVAVQGAEADWPASNDVKKSLGELQTGLQQRVVEAWWQLSDRLVVAFNDGVYTFTNGTRQALGYPAWYLQMIGFDGSFYHPQWVEKAALPPLLLRDQLAPSFLASPTTAAPTAAGAAGFLPGLCCGLLTGAGLMAIAAPSRWQSSTLSARLLSVH